MSARRRIGAWGLCWVAAACAADTPQETARRAMEASVARQRQAVAAMRLSIARQRAAAGTAQAAVEPISAPDFVLAWPALGAACDPLPEDRLAPLLAQAAQKEGLDAGLLRAVAEQESGFRPCAVSPKGAMGLMQLMPATAQDLGVRDPFDPRESLESGAHFLKELLARFGGDAALALSAYNAGPERVIAAGGMPAIPETVRYVERILSRLPIP
ncbi:MAG TPA: lytic transglycosylase domain-containing protein [Bryobacteraceae bacterium]|nr:lytic transglycosylase domain-containing protein [Bryobacteraceae bacterium]